MTRGSSRRTNRGLRASQLVSEQLEMGDVAAENGDLSGDESSHVNRLTHMEERIDQQNLINQQLSNKMEEISSQLQFLVQELKNSKAEKVPEPNGDRERGILGSGGSNDRGILGSGANDRGILGSGARENSSDWRSSPQWGNNTKNSFFSNQKLVQPKSLRLDFPSFSGCENVIAWLGQVEQIFDYYDIKEDEWVRVCSFYLKEEALQWYRWFERNTNQFDQWGIFQEEIITRFGPSELTRPFEAFASIKQTSTVRDYLSRFEQVLGVLEDPPASRHVLDKFIGGLKDELRFEVAAARPLTLKGAISLDDCYGLEAISKAGEIMKGRRWQGVKLVMVKVFIQSLIYVGYNALKASVSNSMVSQLGIGFVLASVSVLASVFEWAISLVFYYDCKRSKEEDAGFMYATVPQETNDYEGAIP